MLTKLGEKYTEATFGAAPSWSQKNTELFPTSNVAFFRIFAFSTNYIFYIALTTTRSLIDWEPTFQNAPAEIPDNDPAPQISISRGVHRWPLCFAIRHAVNAKSVVKLLVCHGEFCFCVKLKVVARPKCKVTNFTFTPACTIERFDLFYMAFHAWPSLK